ncbi:MAG: hypothetical protein JSW34_00665 [Candidatus Zixiibacteriota bacterium]|nr:MAG: hypothetical protein JSW34_00665 [candidate division Zixibacteria bacterium]
MTDSQEKKAKDSQDTQRVTIEFPGNFFQGMFRMMAGGGIFGGAGSSCCDFPQDRCCPPSGEDAGQEFTITIKRKE